MQWSIGYRSVGSLLAAASVIGLAGCPDALPPLAGTSSSSAGTGGATTSSTASTGVGGTGGSGGATTGTTTASSSSISSSSSSSSGMGVPVVKGAFVGGAVQSSGDTVQVQGAFIWHAAVNEGNGNVRVKGWLQ